MIAAIHARVAPHGKSAYPARVSFRRILSLLVLLAVILAPAAMPGGARAAAPLDQHEAAATGGGAEHEAHPCADGESPSRTVPDTCCVMACVAITAEGGLLPLQPAAVSLRQSLPLSRDPHGLAPEADPPPPRFF